MWRSLWTTTVICSFGFLIAGLFHFLFKDESEIPIVKSNTLEVLLEQPPESLPYPASTGNGIPKEPVAPIEATAPSAIAPSVLAAQDEKNALEANLSQLDAIEKELSELPGGPDSAAARTMLLNNASNLELNDQGVDEVHELAMDELLQPTEDEANEQSSSSFAYFLPVLAHEIALKTALDPVEALSITLDGITVHRDPGIRHSLMRQFSTRFPEYEAQLREQLYHRNLLGETQSSFAMPVSLAAP